MFYLLLSAILVLFGLIIFLTQPVYKKKVKPVAHGDIDKLKQHVHYLSVQVNRGHDQDGLKQAAQYIKEQLQQWSPDVSYQEYELDGQIHRNVVANLGPDSEECIIIGAHYDSFAGFPGADDNASAVAGLLELARLLSRQTLKLRIQLVAYTLEEPPYFRTSGMGSYQHASRVKDEKSVRLMICLEMIGYYSDQAGSQEYPLSILKAVYPRVGNFIALVGGFREIGLIRRFKRVMRGASEVPVHSITAPAFIPGIDFSDHQNYWRFKIPAIMVTDTAFYRNPYYHTPEDTEEKLDFKKMSQVVAALHCAVLSLMD